MQNVQLDVQRFKEACEPRKKLIEDNKDNVDVEHQYYIDFTEVRGANFVIEFQRTIEMSKEYSTQLLAGYVGSGKSTELLSLKNFLEKDGFHVVYFEFMQPLEEPETSILDILLAIAHHVSESLEKIQIKLNAPSIRKLIKDIADVLQTPLDLDGIELSIGFTKVSTKARKNIDLRSKLLENTQEILDLINEEVLIPAILKLKPNKKGLVVIVDNLDSISNKQMASGRMQLEYLFVDQVERLAGLKCHKIYTVPLALIFSNIIGKVTFRLARPKVLSIIPVQLKNGDVCEEGINLLRKVVMIRAFPQISFIRSFPNVDKEDWECFVRMVFDSPESLDLLCQACGGNINLLMQLLCTCLGKSNPPFLHKSVKDVIEEFRYGLTAPITDDEWELLNQVVKRKEGVRGEMEYKNLIDPLLIFGYQYKSERWFRLNPFLATSEKLNP